MYNINIFTNLKGNIFGGITAGVIALPLALAFGVASGLGAAAGLWGAIIVCLFATIFGGTPTQISGPTGPISVVVASLVLANPNNFKVIFVAIALAGLIQIALSFSNFAKLIHYVPYPVISGFMSGIGIIIILLQIAPFLGITAVGSPIEQLFKTIGHISDFNPQALGLSCLALALILFTPKKIAKFIPPSLLALIAGTVISVFYHLDVKTIGAIPLAFPSVQIGLISIKDFQAILPMAFTLAILGAIDSLLTSLIADSVSNTKHDSNKELFGQGLGNFVAGIFGGLAGAGATMRTVININNGATTKLSGIVHSLFLIAVVLFFAPFASQIPLAILAAILIKVGIDIIDYKFLNVIEHTPKSDLFIMLTVFFLTVFNDLIFAVGVGVVASAIIFAAKMSQQVEVKVSDMSEYSILPFLDESMAKKIYILNIEGMFFFGTASTILSRIEDALVGKIVIIDCYAVKSFDISATFTLERMIEHLHKRGIEVILILNNPKLARKQLNLGLNKIITRHKIAFSVEKAIRKAKMFFD